MLGLAGASQHLAGHALTVDRHVDRLAHAHVLKRRVLHVECGVPDRGHVGLQQELEALVHQVLDLVPGRLGDHVDLAGPERRDTRRRVGDLAIDHVVELRRLTVIVLVALEHDHHVDLTLDELERPGADRVERDILIAVNLPRGRADHLRLPAGGLADLQPLVVRLGEHDLEGVLVDRAAGLDPASVEVQVGIGDRVVLRRVGVGEAVVVPLRHLGVEGRAVVELDALAQVEGVGPAILGDGPRLGERRPERRPPLLRLAQLQLDQAVEDHVGGVLGEPAAGLRRVEQAHRRRNRPDQRAAALGFGGFRLKRTQRQRGAGHRYGAC